MLEPVDPVFLLLGVDTEKRLDVNVVVHAFDVRVGMVNEVVLDLPQVAAGAHQVQAAGHHTVQAFVLRIAAMRGIVHDVETDSGHREAHDDAGQNRQPQRWCKKHQQHIERAGHGQQEDAFPIQGDVAGFFNLMLFEIGFDALFQAVKKRAGFVVEGNTLHVD